MTQVIIQDIIPRTQLTATAGQTVFNTNWTADASTDIDVYARATGVEPNDATQLVSPSDYNVTFIGGSATVRVTFLVGRTLDDIITIVRNTPATRTNLYVNTNFVPSMLNQDFGILTLVDQQAQMYDTVVNPGYNVSATIEEKDKILPILGPLDVWRMNAAGTEIEAVTVSGVPAPVDAPYWLSFDVPELFNEVNMGALSSGIIKQTVALGVSTPSIAVNGVDYWKPGDIITLPGLPTNPVDAASKEYVDSVVGGFSLVIPVNVATLSNFVSTYNNGAGGLGATLTATSNGAASIDGVSLSLFDRVLFKNQTNTFENGIYEVSQVGDGSNPAIYVRTSDFDTPAEIIPGVLVPVTEGATNAQTLWLQVATVTTIGTDPITFIQYGIIASDIVTISGSQTITGDKEFTGLVEVPTPLTGTEAANKDYVDNNGGFPSGTKMLFVQTSAPTGWTKDTTAALNNSALRVVTGAASSGGTVDFTTAFASQAVAGTNAGFTLTNSEIPSHNHSFSGQAATPNLQTGVTPVALQNNNVNTTGSTGGGGSHTHTFTGTAINLAVKYNDVIICSKD